MTTASAVIPAHLRTDVEALWNYHDMHHELRRTDAGIGLGSHDPGVAMAAAALYVRGIFPLIVSPAQTRPPPLTGFREAKPSTTASTR